VTETGVAPVEVVRRLGEICAGFPDAYEEDAWVGTRWWIRKRIFAQVLTIVSGVPAAYAEAAGVDGPVTVMTFRAAGAELAALTTVGAPFFKARWGRDVVVIVLEDETDWDEVSELLAESYCILAPKGLARRLRDSLAESGD
jgi:hypothetical protein